MDPESKPLPQECTDAMPRKEQSKRSKTISQQAFAPLILIFRPLHLWDKLIPQCMLILNMLRGSRINPALSAHAQVHGQCDFMATPMAPPGIHVVVHEKPNERGTWAPKGKDGWCIGPELEAYRCFKTWTWETQKERKADTLSWFPTHLQMPFASQTDLAVAGVKDITQPLQQPIKDSQCYPLTEREVATSQDLTNIFIQRDAPAQNPSKPPPEPTKQQPKTTDDAVLRVNTKEEPDATHSKASKCVPRKRRSERLKQSTKTTEHDAANTAQAIQQHILQQEAITWLLTLEMCTNNATDAANKAVNPDTGQLADYKELSQSSDGKHWINSCSNEVGRLAQGRHPSMPTGTDTIRFIKRSEAPADRSITYLRIVSTDRPQKTEVRRVRFTVGGDKVDCPFDVSTKTAALSTVKMLLNSVLSTDNAKFMTVDIKDFYLNTPMNRWCECVRIPIDVIPEDIIQQCNLRAIVINGCVCVEIRKGMCGLPQAGRIANDALVPCLAKHGCIQSKCTHGLFNHKTRPVSFSLVVDDFGVKYVRKENTQHLVDTLANKCTITTDWDVNLYCGITLHWDHNNRTVDLSMPGYIAKALQRFQHPTPERPEHSPHEWIQPNYGTPTQCTATEDASQPLDKKGVQCVQEVVGVLLCCARAIDNTMLVALNDTGAAQAKSTQHTLQAHVKLLNYAATHPDATIRFTASNMILRLHTDASCLSAPKARSRAAGFHCLGDDDDPHNSTINGPTHVSTKIMRNVLSSAAEAEVGATFNNAQEACPFRQTLIDLGHPQPATPIQTNNQCTEGILC